uniref:Uncharacterized protein n=1 Tax=viral metagenome TaxID=1070528 RepID=A0A6C0M1S5_9ZZZZ
MERVRIVDKTHKFYGRIGVVFHETPTSYRVRILRERLPLNERFVYVKGRVWGVKYPHYTILVSKKKVVKVKGKSRISIDDKGDTLKLLTKFGGKTRAYMNRVL